MKLELVVQEIMSFQDIVISGLSCNLFSGAFVPNIHVMYHLFSIIYICMYAVRVMNVFIYP